MHQRQSRSVHWRWVAAAGLLVTAAVHVGIAPEHLREAPYAGALFIALSVAAVACAVVLTGTNHPLVWTAAAALSLAALLAYVSSRSVGLPALSDDVGDWLNPLGLAAVLAETAVALISWHVLGAARTYRRVTATVRLYTVVPAAPSEPGGYV
jgi:hypothetical protein